MTMSERELVQGNRRSRIDVGISGAAMFVGGYAGQGRLWLDRLIARAVSPRRLSRLLQNRGDQRPRDLQAEETG